MEEKNHATAAYLLGLIDSGERYLFEKAEKEDFFGGWVDKRYYESEDTSGVLIACFCKDTLRINISFDPDIPNSVESETVNLLKETFSHTDKKAYIWCRHENRKLIALIADAFLIKPNYVAHEMSISKTDFLAWKEPAIPEDFDLKGYVTVQHESYINLLEEAMFHVSPKGTHPYIDQSEHLAKSWSNTSTSNAFISLWQNEKLAGICHGNGGEIVQLAVSKAYQGKGLGYLLLYNTIKRIFKDRDDDLCLYVVDQNEKAYRFYLAIGMKATGHSTRFAVEADIVNAQKING
jgi:ribosomal protein S18 acetylase RimI-like enzyme